MRRRVFYEILSIATLTIAAGAAILAAAGSALQQALSATAAALCAGIFLVPGLYFFRYQRALRARDLALEHVATFAMVRGTIEVRDLAAELRVSGEDADRFLRTAVREGHLHGSFDERGRFVVERNPREREAA